MKNEELRKPKVSVIIPVYNTEAYLEEAVGSICRQTLEDIEIIAVNDGSTDRSPALLSRMQQEDSRITVYTQTNKGLSITRNNGLARALGEFVYFFDSDDFLQPDALQQCYEAALRDGSDIVCFDALCMDDTHRPIDTPPAYQRKGLLPSGCFGSIELLRQLMRADRFSSSPCLNLIRTDFLRKIGLEFYPGIVHEDQLFTFLLYLHAGRISFLPEPFFHRRMRMCSIMTSPVSMRNIDGYLTVCRELKATLSLQWTAQQQELLRQRIRKLVGITASTALPLSFRQRMVVLKELAENFTESLQPASVLLLLMPCLKRKKNKRK